ncbi:hypotheticial protein [Plakobranchus ocellatus]|uniref:Hypotheticial protein n=1 Tax=Plakobranchus ocellatus TaxID=259542 RepID=A0AAV4BH76_9GAST|nr:hypotheticial protein [Plakobranchus ocellatus]
MASSVQNIDPVMEKPWQRAKRMELYDFYRKSAYPPMSIEPVPYERTRLAGEGMTVEQRALRKQWLKDQILHHEPRHVPELQPLNIFRRIYRFPADLLIGKPAMMFFSKETAAIMRYTIPKLFMVFGASYFVWYQLKYHQNVSRLH